MAGRDTGKAKAHLDQDGDHQRDDAPAGDLSGRGAGGQHPGFSLAGPEPLVDDLTPRPAQKYYRATEAFAESLARAQRDEIAAFATMWIDPNGKVQWKFHVGDRNQSEFIGGIECMKIAVALGILNGVTVKAPEPMTVPAGVTKN
jgi:hypothetical protein